MGEPSRLGEKMKTKKRTKPPKTESQYAALWRIVDGAVADAFAMHPDYLTQKGAAHRSARVSINKRVVGALAGLLAHTGRGRSVQNGG